MIINFINVNKKLKNKNVYFKYFDEIFCRIKFCTFHYFFYVPIDKHSASPDTRNNSLECLDVISTTIS